MNILKSALLLLVCLVLLPVYTALAEQQASKDEAKAVVAQVVTLLDKQLKAVNSIPSGDSFKEQRQLATDALRQTFKLKASLEKFTGVTQSDLFAEAMQGLVNEAQRVQKSGTPEEKKEFADELKKLK